MIQVHHAALAFRFGYGPNEEPVADLNFGRPQPLANLVALGRSHHVATLDDDDLSSIDRLGGKQTAAFDGTAAFLGLGREIGPLLRHRAQLAFGQDREGGF